MTSSGTAATTPARRRLCSGATIGEIPPREESETLGSWYFHWAPTPRLWQIDTDEDFSLEDFMQALGRLELDALGYVKYWDVPRRPT
jgi:hypothetical protein